jgi:hypothetical protein
MNSLSRKAGLTLRKRARKSNGKVFAALSNSYARLRLQCGAVSVLREERDTPPERLLQAVWAHQRIVRDQLKTLDGETVRVLHPGFLNREGGPDFRGAVIQFGSETPRAGDVEVDIRSAGWRAHQHHHNPAFANVILHVVWDGDRMDTNFPPRLILRNLLDAPLGELSVWLERDSTESLAENLRGRCCAPLRDLSTSLLEGLLTEAARVRFEGKAARFKARARQVGWEQSLWEGLFRALGYKHNVWPMQCLAELRPRWATPDKSPFEFQARLFGVSGLLPLELTRSQASADSYLRRIWDEWWREREAFEDCVLPRSLWRFHGLRPANHPQRRLGLAAHWLAAGDLIGRIERWCSQQTSEDGVANRFFDLLKVERDPFWSWHWTVRSPRLKKPQPLVGPARATDLAINVILPWLWIRAGQGKNPALQERILNWYALWPAAEDNSLLRLARERLLGGARRSILRTAALQQGMIQIVRDFCDHSNAVCESCRFPDMVKQQWSVEQRVS